MRTAHTCTAASGHRIYLIYENYAWRILLGVIKKVPDSGCAHAHEHLHEIRSGYGKERNSGLACHGLGQQGLTCTRRALHQHTLGDPGSQIQILAGIFEEIHYLLKFFLFLIQSRHLGKIRLHFLCRYLDMASGKGSHLAAASGSSRHEHHEHKDHGSHHQKVTRYAPYHGVLLGVLYRVCGELFPEHLLKCRSISEAQLLFVAGSQINIRRS